MRPEDIRKLLNKRPFAPSRIHMTDGQAFEIRHPDNVLVLRTRVVVGVPADTSTGIPDRAEHCALLHVVRIEELQGTPKANSAE